jgi:hypothetical protein
MVSEIERAIAGALRAAIKDHGPITLELTPRLERWIR